MKFNETKPRRNTGSGVIAGGRYVPPQAPMHRDPFEHMKLAMSTRGATVEPRRVITLNTPNKEAQ